MKGLKKKEACHVSRYIPISSQINPNFNVIPIKISMDIYYSNLQKLSDKLNLQYPKVLTKMINEEELPYKTSKHANKLG